MKKLVQINNFAKEASRILLFCCAVPLSYAADTWAPGEKDLFDRYHALADAGHSKEAIPVAQKWVALCEKIYGPEHPHTGASLHNLAQLYQETGDYTKAMSLCKRALKISEKAVGLMHPSTATALNTLATLYRDTGDYTNAEPLFKRALQIREKVRGPQHPSTANSMDGLASLYALMGDYAKAEPLYNQALKIREKAAGPEHPETAKSLNNLGLMYRDMGDYEKAKLLFTRATQINEKALGPNHSDTVIVLNNLGLLYTTTGEFAKAEPLYKRVLQFREKVLGPEHPATATALHNLAGLYSAMGDHAKAEPLFSRALRIREKILGPEHPDTATTLNTLAMSYLAMEDYAKAESYFTRSLQIREGLFGPEHPATATVLANLAVLYLAMGDRTKAELVAQRTDTADRHNWLALLAFTSENQREAAQLKISPFSLAGTLGNGPLSAKASLWSKGSVLESILDERRAGHAAGADPSLAALLEKTNELKSRLRQTVLEGNRAKLSPTQTSELEDQLADLQKQIAQKVNGFGNVHRALETTVGQVQTALPKNSVLVDFIRYRFHGKNQSEIRYAALVVAGNGEPVFVSLGKAQTLDALIAMHREAAGKPLQEGETMEARNGALEKICRELYDAIAIPVEKPLPTGTRELIFCPDGQLHFLALATLVDGQGRFWGEKYHLGYVATGRDLVKPSQWGGIFHSQDVVLLGNPDYHDSTPLRLAAKVSDEDKVGSPRALVMNNLRGGLSNDARGVTFAPLAGTVLEVADLKARFEEKGWRVTSLTGAKATEPALQKIKAPAILHLATHGFLLDSLELGTKNQSQTDMNPESSISAKPRGFIRDPMLRSGLALSGAQTTMNLWAQGKVPPMEKDGILTAAEAASLNLQGTYLVTLSACETGLGEAKTGEGVMGLKRGFAVAGAENLLLTLWQISDDDTVALMGAFYNRVLNGEHPARALAAVQTEALVRLHKDKGLFYAINSVGPFVLVAGTALPELK